MSELRLSATAKAVLSARYLKKDEKGNLLESPEDMFERVASSIAKIDLIYDEKADIDRTEREFFNIMADLLFLPNSPTLMNAGRELGQLSACFVIPIEDSMDSIFSALKAAALIHKSGGGTGFSFSRLRPKGDVVRTTKGVASGPVSFMKVFDAATETIKQGGTRRGANMGILHVSHPDIVEFITCKKANNQFTNFNISVAVDSTFMEAVERKSKYPLINPRTGDVVDELPADFLFNLIVEAAHFCGDPGIIFIDRINDRHPLPDIIEATNPCGEQPLLPYESCNLGSINLAKMVDEKGGVSINYKRLEEVIFIAVHFLDNVIDANKYPLLEIENNTKANRKIGLGVMGFSEMLYKLSIPYDSDEAIAVAEEVMEFIDRKSKEASKELAIKRGSFPNHKRSWYKEPMRNATTTTIAPTGTLSIIAGTSSGIEPVFSLAYVRNILDGKKFFETSETFLEVAKKEGFFSEDMLEFLAKGKSLRDLPVPEKYKRIFRVAHDISPIWHIKMQAAFQKYTDNAVSKTVNFPKEAKVEDIANVYKLAYEYGCKGVTVYRYGSRETQVLNLLEEKEKKKLTPRPRPDVTSGKTIKMQTGCGALYVTINEDTEGIFEVFAQMGKAGGCAAAQNETTGRLISLALRSGIDIEPIIKQLKGIRCPYPAWGKGGIVYSCSDAIAKALEIYTRGSVKEEGDGFKTMPCPECGSMMEPEGGCMVCRACGFSRCD